MTRKYKEITHILYLSWSVPRAQSRERSKESHKSRTRKYKGTKQNQHPISNDSERSLSLCLSRVM